MIELVWPYGCFRSMGLALTRRQLLFIQNNMARLFYTRMFIARYEAEDLNFIYNFENRGCLMGESPGWIGDAVVRLSVRASKEYNLKEEDIEQLRSPKYTPCSWMIPVRIRTPRRFWSGCSTSLLVHPLITLLALSADAR